MALLQPLMQHTARHKYMRGTPYAAHEFALVAGQVRRRRIANDSFVDTGRLNSFNTPRFYPEA